MQAVPDSFHQRAQGGVRPHTWGLRMSFDKEFDDSAEFFIFDVSLLDGPDLLAPSDDNPIQYWDKFVYYDYADRVVDMEWSREIDFPYSVQAAMADFTLNNYDNYFTPQSGSPIDSYILPKRPLRLYAGYRGETLLQQFVGLTEKMPTLDSVNRTAAFHAMDFLSEMFAMKLTETVAMADVYTDEVLDVLFQQFGLLPEQYVLARGRNKIPFVFFERDMLAGDAFRQLMQAEGGSLWIDEQGLIKFEQRLLPVENAVISFDDSNVESASTSGDAEIINTVRIRSVIRAVQEFQPIFAKADSDSTTDLFIIPANSTSVMEVQLQDPCLSIVAPTLGESSSVSWFTARNSADAVVSSNVSITSDEVRQNSYTMTFQNNNAFPVEVNALEIWGEPAKVVDEINYEAFDEDSVRDYGEQLLGGATIENNLFGSESNCESFALTIIDACKDFAGVIELSAKGDPSLQLGDIMDVDTRQVVGQYKIIKITETRRNSRATQVIKARVYNPRSWFTFDTSLLDGDDVLAP